MLWAARRRRFLCGALEPVLQSDAGASGASNCCHEHEGQNPQQRGSSPSCCDAEWICQLVEHGLVWPSFVPPKPIRELRNLTRYGAGSGHGAAVGTVAAPGHGDVVGTLDHPVQDRLGRDRVREQRLPVGGGPVGRLPALRVGVGRGGTERRTPSRCLVSFAPVKARDRGGHEAQLHR